MAEGCNPWTGGPYALTTADGVTYVAREGRYWRRGRRDEEFIAISNFIVRLVDHQVDPRGKIIHQAHLEIGDRHVELTLSTAALENPRRLLTALTGAARAARADFPVVSDPNAKRLLPELVKATQPARSRVCASARLQNVSHIRQIFLRRGREITRIS